MADMKVLPVVWQRLVNDDGKTCDRCGNTYLEMLRAIEILREKLTPIGIEPILRTKTISEDEFKKSPIESNKIWIANKPLEVWLEAKVGLSQCCAACGDECCRTLEVNSHIYETVPQELIVMAGLKAAEQLMESS